MNIKLTGLVLGTALTAAFFTACQTAPTNTNANRIANTNGNTAVVVNTNTVNVNTGNANRWSNANITREEYERNRAEYERDRGTGTIGQGANDSWLWFKTRAALLTTDDLRESTINVDVANDVVTLRGTVANAAQKTKAETVAKGIDGVRSVKNELKVAPADSIINTNTNVSNTNRSNTSRSNTNR